MKSLKTIAPCTFFIFAFIGFRLGGWLGFGLAVGFGLLVAYVVSQALHSTELRIGQVEFDKTARELLTSAMSEDWGEIRILPHKPGMRTYKSKEDSARKLHSIQSEEGGFIFLEVEPDLTQFRKSVLRVSGHRIQHHCILRCTSPAVPNAIAAIALAIRDQMGRNPQVYLNWTRNHPAVEYIKFWFLGEGQTAPLTHEVLRVTEPDESKRPLVHVV